MTDQYTFLSGGTGTPKLLDGARDVIGEDRISVVVNTADDIEIAGNLVCPDVDTVLYTLADVIDRERWWGTQEDESETHDALIELSESGMEVRETQSPREISRGRSFSGVGEFMHISDRDRATHIYRTSLIDEGATLTEATRELVSSMDIEADVLPMTDSPVSSYIDTGDRNIHFQVFWVANQGEPDVEDVEFRGAEDAEPTNHVLDALSNPVVIGPSNPVTSIGPILRLDGVVEALKETKVVAVSPFVGDEIVSGPAPKLMRAEGLEPSTSGVYDAYSEFLDVLVVDETSSKDFDDLDIGTYETDTMMNSRDDSVRLFNEIINVI